MQRKIIERFYCCFLLLLPFAYSSIIVDPALLPRQLFLSFFVIILLTLGVAKKIDLHYFSIRNPLHLALLGYFVFALGAFFQNRFTSESHAILSKQNLLAIFLIVTTATLYGKQLRERWLIQSVMGFGLIAIGSALYQSIEMIAKGNNLLQANDLIDGFFANKNLLASILFLCIPFFLMGLQLAKRTRILAISGLCLSVLIILISQTRTVFFAILVMGFVLIAFYLKFRFRFRNKTIALFGIAVLTSIILLFKKLLEKNSLKLKPSHNLTDQYLFRIFNSNTLRARTQFWENSIAMFKDHPFFGVGLGNWQVEFPKYGLAGFSDGIANGSLTLQRPHNDFLQVICETGITGFLAYASLFVIICYQLIFLIRESETKIQQWKFVFILGGVAGYVVISIFDFPLERIEHQVLLMILFALVLSAYANKSEIATHNNSIINYLFLFIILYAVVVAAFRFTGERETVKMYQAKNANQWAEVGFHANKAENHFYKIDPTSIPIDWYMGMVYFNQNELDESIVSLQKSYVTAPYQIQVINNLGAAYQARGNNEKARSYYEKALAISPHFEEPKLNMAASYYNQKNYRKAFETIDKVDYTSKSSKYLLYLPAILEKEINRILLAHSNAESARKIAILINTSTRIMNLYFRSKQANVSFETYVINYGNKVELPK